MELVIEALRSYLSEWNGALFTILILIFFVDIDVLKVKEATERIEERLDELEEIATEDRQKHELRSLYHEASGANPYTIQHPADSQTRRG